jgi:hypothetical protein
VNRSLVTLALACVAGVSQADTAAKRVGDFALLDQQGYFHQISYYDDHKAVALLVQSNAEPVKAQELAAFKQARAKYQDKVKFFMINPAGDKRDAVQKELEKYGTDIPVLLDRAQLVCESLGVKKTGEVFLINPGTTEVLYRGPANKHLARAIDDVLAGKPVQKSKAWVWGGAAVKYPARQAHAKSAPSYSKDVAPILADNCARCHREGGIGPFAMTSHTIVKGFAPMIREVVLTKRMPPGQIDPEIGHFSETFTLTPAEQQTLVHWIEAGAQKDDATDPLTKLEWPATKWAYGEPDLVIKIPAQEVPATGVLDYRYIKVPIEGMDRDRWVRASQYIAGDRTVLHHTLNSLVPPDAPKDQRIDFGNFDPNAARITAYIPGAQPQHEPPNTGGLLKKGSTLALQLHYTTNGKATVDAGEIGLWFYKDGEVPTERMIPDCACIFTKGWDDIPPYDADHEMKQTITIKKDAHIHSMLPHMHFRGKRMRFYAEYPDGRKEELLNIAKYNYNWQLDYQLTEPKFVPAGTKITAVGAFDNSTQNKANPDPARKVPWGQQSWDEMFFGAVTYKFVQQSGTKVADNK